MFKAQPAKYKEQKQRTREEIHAINFDCKTKSHVHAGGFSSAMKGKLLHHVIISYMTRRLTLNRKFTRCTMIPDNTPLKRMYARPVACFSHKSKFPNACKCTLLLWMSSSAIESEKHKTFWETKGAWEDYGEVNKSRTTGWMEGKEGLKSSKWGFSFYLWDVGNLLHAGQKVLSRAIGRFWEEICRMVWMDFSWQEEFKRNLMFFFICSLNVLSLQMGYFCRDFLFLTLYLL